MSKKLSILFLLAAMFTMLAHAAIPHHEHADKICFEKIHCENEEAESSSHTHATGCCFENYDLIRPQNENQLTCEQGHCCDFHFPPILLFIGNFFDLEETTSLPENPLIYLNLYTSADITSSYTLRGPPQARI